MGRLSGKRCIVTEANGFMGPAVVELFGEEGAEVIADARDLTRSEAAAELIREAGRVDVLIVNLSVPLPGVLAHETTDEQWHRVFDRLVHPLHRLCRAVLPQMIERRGGKIVVIGGAAALRASSARPAAYSAARGAQHAYVRQLGFEVARYDVQVNATGQSFVENPVYFPPGYAATPELKKRLEEVPAGRLATGREAALFILFLASNESDFFVGQVFPFAGGWVT
jgi:2-keto-3-deoxy-L-fuconate dehydrogenase